MKTDPAVEDVMRFRGRRTAQNQARMFVMLKPLKGAQGQR